MQKMESKKRRMLFTAIISAIGYGSWAFYINNGSPDQYTATFVQFICSFTAGYFVASIVEWVFWKSPSAWRFTLASLGPFSIALTLFALIHFLAGTQQIFITILPNMVIGIAYFQLYCIGLERLARKDNQNSLINT